MARGRCDHDPAAPRLRLLLAPRRRPPKFIGDAVARSARLYEHPQWFPELTGHSIAGRDARIRTRRSSRREAWALMSAAIWRRTDRRTWRIGDQRDDDLCNGVPVAWYMKATGLSRYRVNVTLREFEGAGYIVTTTQPVEELETPRPRPNGRGMQTHRAFPAQRRVTDLFAERMAFTAERIKKARKRGYEDWQRRRARALSPIAILGLRGVRRKLGAGGRRPSRYYEIELRLKAEHPDWAYDRVRREAETLFKTPPKPPSAR